MDARTTTQESAPFVARTTGTEELVAARAANDIIEFYRRQNRLTGTDVEWLRADHPAVSDVPDSADVESVLRVLDDQFTDGVPIGIVTAAMSRQDLTVGETLESLYELRMAGALWEPREDHLRPVR